MYRKLMIHTKTTDSLSLLERIQMNDLIHSCFHHKSRLDTYDTVLYFKDNESITGFIGLHTNKYKHIDTHQDITVLNQICVKKNYRNKGIASNMIRSLDNIYENTRFLLYVDKGEDDTEHLHAFYQKRGFCDVDLKLIESAEIPYNSTIEYAMIK
jgi:ribosomal protein S18 acetylase RimI-like enzyme